MTKREREQREWMQQAVERLGFTSEEFHALRRISMTLHRWHEHECNGNIQRDGDDGEGKPRWHYSGEGKGYRIADRERGALKRLAKIMADANTRFWVQASKDGFAGPIGENPRFVHSYIQGDPRGAALYLVPVAELRGQPIDSVYSRGVAIY
jgi:hypothetical protein